MCGITGYIGQKEAAKIILEGLHALEYRGYDSAGIAVYKDGGIEVTKAVGKVAAGAHPLGNTRRALGRKLTSPRQRTGADRPQRHH